MKNQKRSTVNLITLGEVERLLKSCIKAHLRQIDVNSWLVKQQLYQVRIPPSIEIKRKVSHWWLATSMN